MICTRASLKTCYPAARRVSATTPSFLSVLAILIIDAVLVLFGDRSTAPEIIPAHLAKFFTVVEGMVPSSGFVNGESFPTVADLAVLCMMEAMTPIGLCIQLAGGVDLSPYPKMSAICSAVKASPGVKEYLAKSATLAATPKM